MFQLAWSHSLPQHLGALLAIRGEETSIWSSSCRPNKPTPKALAGAGAERPPTRRVGVVGTHIDSGEDSSYVPLNFRSMRQGDILVSAH
jgi:hypothetical protein